MESPRQYFRKAANLTIATVLLLLGSQAAAEVLDVAGPRLEPKKGRFLVATKNLAHSSFKETVIFVTHFSSLGATGITINRPANIPINEAFPNIKELSDVNESLYLGGPVHTNGIFVLLKTKRPHAGMKEVTKDIYFTAGLSSVVHSIPKAIEGESTRAYAGYSGWGPGQLQAEIKRGDWIIVEADPEIIFENNDSGLWQKLYKTWSGNWI